MTGVTPSMKNTPGMQDVLTKPGKARLPSCPTHTTPPSNPPCCQDSGGKPSALPAVLSALLLALVSPVTDQSYRPSHTKQSCLAFQGTHRSHHHHHPASSCYTQPKTNSLGSALCCPKHKLVFLHKATINLIFLNRNCIHVC